MIEQFRDMSLICEETSHGVKLGMLKLTSDILEEIWEGQKSDLILVDRLMLINQGRGGDFWIDENGIRRCRDIVCVPYVGDFKKGILEESHRSKLSIHLGATKMYQDLKILFLWPGIKSYVARFVYACLTYQKSKVEHQKPAGLLQPLEVPEWKWDSISMDFVMGLPNTSRGHDIIWVIVDRLTKLAYFIPINISFPV